MLLLSEEDRIHLGQLLLFFELLALLLAGGHAWWERPQ
jgi:hypothetical protein